MMPDPIFLNIHMYGIMIAIGVLSAFATLFAVAKKKWFYNKCWGQAHSLTPTFIIEPKKIRGHFFL